MLKIIGVVVFSVLIGVAANRLLSLYSSGELFDQYNSQRKTNITLLIFSMIGLATLGYFEYLKAKLRHKRRGYVPMKVEERKPLPEDPKVASIYSAPDTLDKWDGRKTRNSRSRHSDGFEMTHLWMRVLRIYCAVLPVIYLYALVEYLVNWLPYGMGNLFLTVLLITLFVLSVMTSVGVLRKRLWGVHYGYAIAIFNLLIFPIGTAAGLIMLVALAGVAPEFLAEARTRRRQARKEARENIHGVMA
jgi:hypothetical protein